MPSRVQEVNAEGVPAGQFRSQGPSLPPTGRDILQRRNEGVYMRTGKPRLVPDN